MDLISEEAKQFGNELNHLFTLQNNRLKAIHLIENLIVVENDECCEFYEVSIFQEEILLSSYSIPPLTGEN